MGTRPNINVLCVCRDTWVATEMDCAPTLDVVDGLIEEEEEEAGEDRPKVWGRFFPLGKGFMAQGKTTALVESVTHQDSSTCDDVCRFCPCADFVKEEYTFGRGETCDYSFESHGGRMNAHFLAISKTHFRIFRVRKPPFCAFLTRLC